MHEPHYERPKSAEEACALLADPDKHARVLAGGTDLLVDFHLHGTAEIGAIVDIKGLPGIAEIRWSDAGDLEIGACVTMRQIYEDERLNATYPGLAEGAKSVGSPQVRHRATIGGNLCNASPGMDTAPPLLVLDARIHLAGPEGKERTLPLKDFFVGVKRTALEPGEIALSLTIPATAQKRSSAFDKIKRVNGHDIALVNVAVSYDPDAQILRGTVGSAAITPIVLPALGDVAPNAADADAVGDRLAESALEHISPISDVRASETYRRAMVALLCRRLVKRLLAPTTPPSSLGKEA